MRWQSERMIHTSLIRAVAIVLLSAVLGACGFQLRGSHDYPFKRLYIAGAPTEAMRTQMKRMIEAGSDTKVLDKPAGADAILTLSSGQGQGALSFNTAGVVQEYVLNTSVSYTLTTPTGTVLIGLSSINVNRSMTYSDTYALAKYNEATLLYNDMNSDIAEQLVQRLQVVRTLQGSQVPSAINRAPLPTPPL